MFGLFFRRTKPVQFDYKPRYYDEQKEAREKRLAHKDRVRNGDVEAIKDSLSATFKRQTAPGQFAFTANRSKIRRQQTRRANIIRIIIFAILALAAYWLITVYLPRFEAMI